MSGAHYTTRRIGEAIKAKYCDRNEYLVAFEVESDHPRKTNYCDAMAISNWPSRGNHLIGFEVKASRSDWLRELKKPEKAEAFYRYCTNWIIAAVPGVVKKDELPPGWGLMELSADDKLRTVVPPTKNPNVVPMSPLLSMRIMRRLASGRDDDVVRCADRYITKLRQNFDEAVKAACSFKLDDAKKVIAMAEKIQKECGINLIYEFESIQNIAADIRVARAARKGMKDVEYARNSVKAALRELEAALAPREPITEETTP